MAQTAKEILVEIRSELEETGVSDRPLLYKIMRDSSVALAKHNPTLGVQINQAIDELEAEEAQSHG